MNHLPTKPIGIFYGSSTCYTEMVAEDIFARLGDDRADLHNIKDIKCEIMQRYPILLLGIPTWDYGELQEDWDDIWDDLETLDLSQSSVAIFGLGDQVGYGKWFQDALGFLYHHIKSRGANMMGEWPNQGYTFEGSQALNADKTLFLGLPIDQETQPELTEQRINSWLEQLGLITS